MLNLLYTSVIRAVVAFGLIFWDGNIHVYQKNKLHDILKWASKLDLENSAQNCEYL